MKLIKGTYMGRTGFNRTAVVHKTYVRAINPNQTKKLDTITMSVPEPEWHKPSQVIPQHHLKYETVSYLLRGNLIH